MWFAAMASPNESPWTFHLVWKLLHNDPDALSLLAGNPFPDKAPCYVRATLYRYKFVPANDAGIWWEREELGAWLPPLSADDPELLAIMKDARWYGTATDHRRTRASIALAHRLRRGDIAGFQLKLFLGRGAENACAIVVEFTFPTRDDNGGQTVADQVHGRAAHIH